MLWPMIGMMVQEPAENGGRNDRCNANDFNSIARCRRFSVPGQVHYSRMNEHPGDRIQVRVSVDPVHP